MKYKAGDKVRIKSLDWYNENKDINGNVHCGDRVFDNYMSVFCGSVVTIGGVGLYGYAIREDLHCRTWTDEMIEGLAEESDDFEKMYMESKKRYEEEYSKGEYCHEQSFKWGFQEGYDYAHENEKLEISLKEGYQFKDENGNVINAQKIVLEKKSPKTNDIIKWLREHNMTKYINVLYSGMCSIRFDTEELIKDIIETIGDV